MPWRPWGKIAQDFSKALALQFAEGRARLFVGPRVTEPDVRSDLRGIHAAQPDAEPLLLHMLGINSELGLGNLQHADCEVGISHTLSIAADRSTNRREGIQRAVCCG